MAQDTIENVEIEIDENPKSKKDKKEKKEKKEKKDFVLVTLVYICDICDSPIINGHNKTTWIAQPRSTGEESQEIFRGGSKPQNPPICVERSRAPQSLKAL